MTPAPLAATDALDGFDPLSDVLRAVRLSGALFFLVDATSPWQAEAPAGTELAPVILPGAQHVISYHVVTEGSCFAMLPGAAPVRLTAGDIVVIPRGDPYLLCSAPVDYAAAPLEVTLPPFRYLATRERPFTLKEGGGGPDRLHVACGFLGCDAFPFNPIVATLPTAIYLRPSQAEAGRRLRTLIDFALTESRERRAGGGCVLLRISELMFVELLRCYLAALPAEQTGWLAGLSDPTVGRALGLLHRQPARPWTLEELARQSGRSRSALADHFSHLLGQPPMQYLARWRMQLAARLLLDTSAKVSAVALEVGYESEAAFSRAFKKMVGVAPAAWRETGVGRSSSS